MKVSVVIPCRNEKNHIKECIDAIYSNSICETHPIEVLVIDGMSDDGTLDVLDGLKTTYPSLKVVNNEKRVTPVAFNLGIKHAKGEFIQIIGARQIISNNYLEKAVEKLESNREIWCLGGAVENIFENHTSEVISKAMDSPFGVGGSNFRLAKESKFVDTVGTPMYPAHVFEKIGIFDEALVRNQDDELNYRVTQAGGKILLFSDIQIKYLVRAAYDKLYKQYFQYGYWKVYVNRKLKTITTLRQLVPALMVFSLALGLILSFFHWVLLLLFLSGLLMYLLACVYFASKKTSNPKEIRLIIFTFFILHFGYGSGYIKGIVDFLILNKKPSKKNQELSR